MTTVWKSSKLVTEQLPEFVREMSPNLVTFMRAYYEWLETTGQNTDNRHNFLNNLDIDKTLDRYVDYFHDEYMRPLPRHLQADRRLVLKHIRDQLYRAKGSERGYKFLFRILFGEDVDFYYPGTDLLRLSDGKWFIARSLKATNFLLPVEDIESYQGKELKGQSTGAIGLYEYNTSRLVAGVEELEVFVSLYRGAFANNETIVDKVSDTPLFVADEYKVYPGQYLNEDGFLSSSKKMQDNYYWQEFSYVLKANRSVNDYEEVVKSILHPAGTIMFGEVSSFNRERLGRPQVEEAALELFYTTTTANVTPIVIGSVGYETTSPTSLLEFEIQANTFVSANGSHYKYTSAIAGNVSSIGSSANIGPQFQSQSVGIYQSFEIGDIIYATKLFTGVGTSFTTALANNDIIVVVDPVGGHANTYNEIETVLSDTFVRLKFNWPYGTLANGQFIRVEPA